VPRLCEERKKKEEGWCFSLGFAKRKENRGGMNEVERVPCKGETCLEKKNKKENGEE
jgi:hypothetical protein